MAIITSLRSPASLNELVERIDSYGMTPIESILNGNRAFGDWTVAERCQTGDVVFFFCGRSQLDALTHVVEEAIEAGNAETAAHAKRELILHKCYAGHIMAVGKVANPPRKVDSNSESGLVPGSWHAEISEFHLLKNPISIDQFGDFITIAPTAGVTKLDVEQTAKLLEIVMFGNLR